MENTILLKKCKVCGVEKDSILEFRYHKGSHSFCGKCKECENLHRRDNYISKATGIIRKYKICKICNTSKLRTEENFKVLSDGKRGKIYSKSCIECRSAIQLTHTKKRRHSSKDENIIKKCNLCLEEKPLSEYYFHFKLNTHSYCCISCESKRKKEWKKNLSKEDKSERDRIGRDYYHKNKVNHLLRTYEHFDHDRNYKCDLDREFIVDSLSRPCSYCGYESTGVDRIDNNIGHIKSNCVPSCRDCNTAKMDNFSYEEMLILGKAIKEIKDKRNQIQWQI